MKTAVSILLLLVSAPAWAIPTVVLTGGSISVSVNFDFAPQVHLEGPGVTLDAVDFFTHSTWNPADDLFDLRVGDVFSLTASGEFRMGPGSGAQPTERSTWTIVTGPMVAHVGLNTAPFSLNGQVLSPAFQSPADVVLFDYSGLGTASIRLDPLSPSLLDWRTLTYTLETPEPAAGVLFCSGLAGLGGMILWRTKNGRVRKAVSTDP